MKKYDIMWLVIMIGYIVSFAIVGWSQHRKGWEIYERI